MGCGASTAQGHASGSAGVPHTQAPPAQQPQPQPSSALEAGYARHQALISGGVKVAAALVGASGFPGAGLLAEAMLKVVELADTATENRGNCRQMAELVLSCDKALGQVPEAERATKLGGCQEEVSRLTAAVQSAREVVEKCGQGRGVLMRLMMAVRDADEFHAAHKSLMDAMAALGLVVGMQAATYVHERSKLAAEMCRLAGCEDAASAFAQLKEQGRLLELLPFFSPEEQALLQVARALTVQDIKDMRRKTQEQESHGLAPYLRAWWQQHISGKPQVEAPRFLQQILKWFDRSGLAHKLEMYDEELGLGGTDGMQALASPSASSASAGDRRQHIFLECVLLPLLDEDSDGLITRDAEMVALQLRAEEWAALHQQPQPQDVLSLLDAVHNSFDRSLLQEHTGRLHGEEVRAVTAALGMQDVIRSYKVPELLNMYVPGSREWLYKRVEAWLDLVPSTQTATISQGQQAGQGAAAAAGSGQGQQLDAASRMFLLLAGPGMGKSVFSAVVRNKLMVRSTARRGLVTAQHFFKVGQQRAQARAMLLSLAHQLSERLPGFAAQLRPVVEKQGAGGELTLVDTFEQYLLQPLQALEGAAATATGQGQGHALPWVLLLIDALDEADDGRGNWVPVAVLLNKEFRRLPSFVRIVLTSRPEASRDAHEETTTTASSGSSTTSTGKAQALRVEDLFKAWVPEWIKPSAAENQQDMRMVLRHRLQQGGLVQEAELEQAVSLMQAKSGGQFVWLKFALEQLASRDRPWSTAELQLVLVDGLYGTYRYLLHSVRNALLKEGQSALWEALHSRVLPVLLAVREPPTLPTLAWLCGLPEPQVKEGLELLENLFPCRAGGADGQLRVLPYHKSVLDWLGSEADAGPELWASSSKGHGLAADACWSLRSTNFLVQPDSSIAADQQGYVLRHLVSHLVRLPAQQQDLKEIRMVELLLQSWSFLEVMITQRLWPGLMREVSSLAAPHSKDLRDALLWLRLSCHIAASSPDPFSHLLISALQCPYQTAVFVEAEKEAGRRWGQRPTLCVIPPAKREWGTRLAKLPGHTRTVRGMAYSPDGAKLATGSDDGTARIWDAATLECIATLQVHASSVWSLAFSPDGSKLATASLNGIIQVWNATTLECEGTTQKQGWIIGLVYSPDGTRLSTGHHIWDAATLQCIGQLQGQIESMNSVAFSPCGTKLVTAHNDKLARIWDATTLECTAVLQGHASMVNKAVFSPDGSKLATACFDATVRIWDAQTRDSLADLRVQSLSAHTVAFSPDGKKLVTFGGGMKVWDIATLQCATFSTGLSMVKHVAYSPDGSKVAVIEEKCSVPCILNVSQEGSEASSCPVEAVATVAFSSDGSKLATSAWKDAHVWDTTAWQCLSTFQGYTGSVHEAIFSPDGSKLALAGQGMTKIWNLAALECVASIPSHTNIIVSIAFSPDGTKLATGSWDKTVCIWDVTSNQSLGTLHADTQNLRCLAFSPDNSKLVTAEDDPAARVWSAASSERIATLEGHKFRVTCISFSPCGSQLVTASCDHTIRVWDTVSFTCKTVLQEHTDLVLHATFSPDGSRLATGGYDKTVRIWDATSWQCLATLQGHTTMVTKAIFSPDGSKLATTSNDSSARVWDVMAGQCEATLHGHTGDVTHVTFSPDGSKLATVAGDQMVRIWDVAGQRR